MSATTVKFRKVGNAYVANLQDGERFWIKRRSGRWDLIWQHRDPLGGPMWGKLATHPTLKAAIEDGEALMNV